MEIAWEEMALAMQNSIPLIEVRQYTQNDKILWNDFVRRAKNGHFFFCRDFMEYHADRFLDHSLLFFINEKLSGLLPANLRDNILLSHEGLTYGGMLLNQQICTVNVVEMFSALRKYMQNHGINELIYKTMPYIYFVTPSEEDRYALFLEGAELYRRDLSSVIDMSQERYYTKGKKYNISKAKKHSLSIAESNDYSIFYKILKKVLMDRHGISPVHTETELTLLAARFPKEIKMFLCFDSSDNPVAGAVLFCNERVIHTQYLACMDEGTTIGALDYLLDFLIKTYQTRKYFSFGISTTNHGQDINYGLLASKEAFGARAMVHDFYRLKL